MARSSAYRWQNEKRSGAADQSSDKRVAERQDRRLAGQSGPVKVTFVDPKTLPKRKPRYAKPKKVTPS
jgi:hypothetical protein